METLIFLFLLAAVALHLWRPRWWTFVLTLPAVFVLWGVGGLLLAMGSVHGGFLMVLWTFFCLGLLLFFLWDCARVRAVLVAGLLLMAGLPVGCSARMGYDYWTKGRFEKLENRVDWNQYHPFSPGNKLEKVEVSDLYLWTETNGPCIACAYALYPIGAAAVQGVCPRKLYKGRRTVCEAASPQAFERLARGWSEIVLGLAPSAEQRAVLAGADVPAEKALRMVPIAEDAFVFFVPVTNPIEDLTARQVRDIYAGKITTWRELGVDIPGEIKAFQRNKGSGSQTALERVMGDRPIRQPIKEDRLRGMGGVISVAADYRNYPGALGFSFRYYLETLVQEKKVKMLKIDGVAPTAENVRNGTYPFVETAYAMTRGEPTGDAKKFVDFLVSPAGRELMTRIGYTVPR